MTDIEQAKFVVADRRRTLNRITRERNQAATELPKLDKAVGLAHDNLELAMRDLEQAEREQAAGSKPDTDRDVAVTDTRDGNLRVKIGGYIAEMTKGQARAVVGCLTDHLMKAGESE